MAFTRFNSIARAANEDQLKGIKIPSPASGKVTVVTDPVLLALGEGVSVELTKGQVNSPFSAQVIEAVPSFGKVVLRTNNKMKFLLQLPPDYAKHLGVGIGIKVKVGDKVVAGQPLLELDLYKMQQHIKPVALTFLVLDPHVLGRLQVPYSNVEMAQDVIFSLVPLKKKK